MVKTTIPTQTKEAPAFSRAVSDRILAVNKPESGQMVG
ncbi:hypothetical protein ARZXY2_4512 (plasmid) [Arthrobacter sp. ZXY-2]|nr:hypothetical protein ARZXY2_4512 [Arthrobacter sp. ZXY-2]